MKKNRPASAYLTAVVASLVTGSALLSSGALAQDKAPAATPSATEKEKNGCGGPNGCGGKTKATDKKTSAAAKDTHACKGKNSCKGKGGCKTDANACAGKNACKGKGGCAVPAKSQTKPATEKAS